jgi:uncharacterized protein (TIGR01777 family)
MRIGITGASGFIGSHVSTLAREHGHEVIAYSRHPKPGTPALLQPADKPWELPEPDQPLETLIHLAGEPVFGLWTASKRARIRDSRVAFTENLVHQLASWTHPPKTLICASAVGFYGDRGNEVLTEASAAGSGFLAGVCLAWEAAASQAEERFGARVVNLRTGLVLGREGGPLPLMRRAFSFGLGGNFGSGAQWMPWIHIADEAGLILFAAEFPAISGALNLCAPNAVTNATFTRALATALHRPAFLHAPAFALKTALGDMAQEMLLNSQHVLPAAAQAAGYHFQFPNLTAALTHLLAR